MKKDNKLKWNDTVHNLKRSWRFAKKQKKYLFGYMFTSLVLCIIGALTPMITAQVLLRITGEKWNELLTIAILVFIMEISRNLFHYFANKTSQIFFRETLLDLQMTLASEILRLETKEIDNNSSGIFIDRLNRDSGDIANIFTELNYSINDIVANIGILVAIFAINKIIFLYFLFGLIVLFILNHIRMKKYFEIDKKFRKIREKNTGLITELVRGMRDIKVLNASKNFLSTMHLRMKEANDEQYKMSTIKRTYNFWTGSLQDSLTIGFVFLGLLLIKENMLITANFVVLYMYQGRVYNLLSYFTQFLEYLRNFNLSANRVFEIIENEKYTKETFGEKTLLHINGDFSFKNVTFSYKEENKILDRISFDVKANETVAFVGKSGAGKTTIFGLLTRLYHPLSGEITIDGVNINQLTEASLRNNISIITQNPYIFNFTIRENLKIVKSDATDEEIETACKMACIHDFIMTLENGYDTMVGEGGYTLSGGQRQRLAIARAFIRRTEIILFDEATSALDNETQRSIQEAIRNMKGEYTILMIAHRLSTVIDSDRIILIDEGKIAGSGSHQQLLKENKIYRALYETELEK